MAILVTIVWVAVVIVTNSIEKRSAAPEKTSAAA